MKKSLIALSVLAAFAGSAMAQSSVTIYGKIDVGVGKPSSTEDKMVMDPTGSRIAFKGVEDLGGGMKALFAMEHRFSPDDGTSASSAFWNGYSFVALEGGFGRVSLGRQYSPNFTMVQNQVDPFAGETVAQVRHVGMFASMGAMPVSPVTAPGYGLITAPVANYRVPNSVRYDAKFGGFAIGALVAETAPVVGDNTPFGVAVSYEAGPLYLALGYEDPMFANDKLTSLAARYNFGFATISLGATDGTTPFDMKARSYLVGANIPFGSNDLKIGFAQAKLGSFDYTKVGLGLHHNLSKRTKLYADLSHVGGNASPSEERVGYDLGIQHNF